MDEEHATNVSGRPGPGEFQAIRRYFSGASHDRSDVLVGIGDDAAVLAPPAGTVVHTVQWTWASAPGAADGELDDPAGGARLAARAMDRAMQALEGVAPGAEPAWTTLALTLPRIDEAWLDAFATTLLARGQRARIALVGGDTTRGPLALTLTLHGLGSPRAA